VKANTSKDGEIPEERVFIGLEELQRAFEQETGGEILASKISRYHKNKLLPPPEQGEKGDVYTLQHFERLKMIEHLRSKYGMPIKDIAGIIGVVESTPGQEPVVEPEAAEREVSRREQIIRNASLILEAKGFNGTTIDDIVQATGIAKGTFYIYFHNKEELLLEVVRKLVDDIIERLELRLQDETDFFKRLFIRGSEFAGLYFEKNDLLNVLIGQTVGNPALARQLREIYKIMADPVKEDLRTGMQQGQLFKIDDVETVAYSLIGMAQMVAYGMALDEKYKPEEATATLFTLVERSLLKHPGDS
jgi:AcrR family transcriptional regulator